MRIPQGDEQNCELVDIQTIEIDPSLPVQQRIAKFVEDIRDPYHFRCGDISVEIEFTEDAPPLGRVLTDYFVSKKAGE